MVDLGDELYDWLRATTSVVAGPRRRRTRVGSRLHVEIRSRPHEAAELRARIAALGAAEPGVLVTDVNAVLHRALVTFDPARIEPECVVAMVEQAERECGLDGRPFGADLPEHPGDLEPIVRLALELGADVAGFWLAVLGQLSPLRPLALQSDVLALVSALQSIPALRQRLDAWVGPTVSSLWLGVGTAIAQGLAQSPLGPVVDVAHRSLQAVERVARRRVWLERESALCAVPAGLLPDAAVASRVVPIPAGEIERYAERAVAGSLGAFGIGLAVSGSLAGAAGMLVGGLPRPAWLGREAYAAVVAYTLAGRGVVSLDPDALRRLDRIDCLLVAASLVAGSGYDALVEHAHTAGLEVEIVEKHDDPAARVRALQQAGRVVLLVSDGVGAAERAADVAVSLRAAGIVPAWGAHLLGGTALDDARLLVDACAGARRVAHESVRLAEAGIGIGTLAMLGERADALASWRLGTAMHVASLLALANGARHGLALATAAPVAERDPTPWHALEASEALRRLETSLHGLGAAAAERRAEAPPPAPSFAERLLRTVADELTTPLAPILAVGASMSAAIGAVTDATLIGAVVVANAAIGAVERLRTDDAIAALRTDRPRTVRVLRAGRLEVLPATALVRGDVVFLEAGELVPADCRIVEAYGLEVDESALTGESLPVVKHAAPIEADEIAERGSILFEGTAIAAGRALAVAFAVGDATESRRGGAGQAPGPSGVEARLGALVAMSAPLAIGSGVVTAAAGLLRGRPLREVLSGAVGLTVAAVPEGLPMMATAAQLAAARRLAARGVLVRNARAIEALGRAQVLCVDKTGTVTEGRIALGCVSDGVRSEPVDALGPVHRGVLRVALRATPRTHDGQRLPHGTDRALVEGAARLAMTGESDDGWTPLSELPFESDRGFHAVLGRASEGLFVCVKGAPEVVLPRCLARQEDGAVTALDEAGREALVEAALALASRGLRVLAVADVRVAENGELRDERVDGLVFRGFLGLADPVRPSAVRAVAALRRAGVRVVMITGDHPSTAESIAAELGLGGGRTLTGAALDELDDATLARVAPDVAVFARVAPRHKARIVDALERAGATVGMTGDGANDAPALRRASIGIAVGARCTTAARNAADLVVTDDRIEALVDVLLEGRAMWPAVRDALAILLGGNLGEVGFTVAGSVTTGTAPLDARQLLLVNLLTDTAPALAVALRPPPVVDPDALLREGPEASLGTTLLRDVTWRGLVTGVGAGAAWSVARRLFGPARASTVGLVALVASQAGQTLVSGGRSPLVLGSSLGSLAALAAVVQTPGVSHFFGCRPLGPIGWTIAGTASMLATGASILRPNVLPVLEPWLARLEASLGAAGTLFEQSEPLASGRSGASVHPIQA
jgi:cation-transporting ATPase I